MKKTTILLQIIISITLIKSSIAQTTFSKHSLNSVKSATINLSDIKEEWNPVLQNIEMPHPGINDTYYKIHRIKDSLQNFYSKKENQTQTNYNKAQAITAPYVGLNFLGNPYNNSTPCDNDVAISNGGKLISVINSSVWMKDVVADTLINYMSLNSFFLPLGNLQGKFDPKVLYDPNSDKFILVCLAGFTDSTSSILVGFSQTNNPGGTWNVYELPGNPLNNTLWTDYPMISVSNNELFITVNLLYNNMPWQTGFNETVIWQVNKNSGYNGYQTLVGGFYNNIQFGGRNIRNLCPVKGGSTPYGPNQYFVSNRNLDPQNDTIFLVNLTDTFNSPNAMIVANAYKSSLKYTLPPTARQSNNYKFETNDQRILGAFFENNKIQFVQNSLNTGTGFAAIYHGIISNVAGAPTVSASILSDPLLDLGYANISYAGNAANDNTSIITFDHSSPTVFAGTSAAISDGTGMFSPISTIANGLNYVIVINGFNQRWGDYSGSQRKYDQPGVVWMSGEYGTNVKKNAAWVAQVSVQELVSNKTITSKEAEVNFYPNPTTDIINVNFTLNEQDALKFEVYDMQGKLINTLLYTHVKKGENMFSFSTQPLSSGSYLLKISSSNTIVVNKKFIKE